MARQSMMTRLVMPVDLVGLLAHRHALDQILEVDDAIDLGEHRTGIGIPLGERWCRA